MVLPSESWWEEGHINKQSPCCATTVMVGDLQKAVGIISRYINTCKGQEPRQPSILSCNLRDEQELKAGGRGHSPSEITRGGFNEETLRSSVWLNTEI